MMKNNGGTCGAKISRCKGAGTNMIRIALFDDDSVFMEQTRILIFEILRKNNVGANVQTFLDGDQASQEILATLDICFLDIDFAGKATSGFDIARRIRLVRQDSILIFLLTTLIISKKPGNTGISRDIRTEFTTDLLLSD